MKQKYHYFMPKLVMFFFSLSMLVYGFIFHFCNKHTTEHGKIWITIIRVSTNSDTTLLLLSCKEDKKIAFFANWYIFMVLP